MCNCYECRLKGRAEPNVKNGFRGEYSDVPVVVEGEARVPSVSANSRPPEGEPFHPARPATAVRGPGLGAE